MNITHILNRMNYRINGLIQAREVITDVTQSHFRVFHQIFTNFQWNCLVENCKRVKIYHDGRLYRVA